MALLVSTWSNGAQSMPKDYIMPPDRRPGDFLTVCKDIPVIDLDEKPGTGRSDIVQQILSACQEFGLFQVINHGVPEKIMEDMRILYKEFFGMPVEDKLDYYNNDSLFRKKNDKNDSGKSCRLYTSGLSYNNEETHYWKDTLSHPCHPLEEHMPSWPNKPARYRDEVGRYTIEMRKLGSGILDLISEGLGLKEGYFGGVMSHEHGIAINHYPPCPDPSLAMGIGGHNDPNLISIIQQDQFGLQIHKDGQWLGVEAIPNAFVVNLGYQLQIISNGKLKSAEHRGVTNSNAARTSIVTFFGPDRSVVIEPAKELVTSGSPQKFKAYEYKEFLENYLAYVRKPMPLTGTPLDPFML